MNARPYSRHETRETQLIDRRNGRGYVGWRQRWRTAPGLVAVGALVVLPGLALASSANDKIPNGYYATVVGERHVPTGEDVEFTLQRHSALNGLSLTCYPNPAVASETADSGYAQVLSYAKKVTLKNGNFSYHGSAKVTAAYAGAPKVATATLIIKGKYEPHGKVYHYTGTIENKVTATLTFEGTATSTACASKPKTNKFYLYRTVSSGGE
jgi:hypothetical protein